MTVEWRPIPGYEGFYEASENGDIRVLDRRVRCAYGATRVRKGRVLRPWFPPREYGTIEVVDAEGTSRRKKVQHLVAAAFLGPRPEGLCVLHKNDEKRDNAVTNLYYGTRKQNAADSVANGKQRPGISLGEKHGHAKLKERDIPEILSLRAEGVPFRQIAARFGVTDMTIHDVVKGQTWGWLTGLGAA